MTAAYERSEFRNSVSWTVSIQFVVAGGSRRDTARGRAEKVAARLASAAARLPDVVEVRAKAGETSPTEDFIQVWPQAVAFDAANSGEGTYGRPELRYRYLDPDRERALAVLAEANAAYRSARDADLARRRAAGCANRHEYSSKVSCECVYCAPATYLMGLTHPYPARSPHPINAPRCVCGITVGVAGARCRSHRDVQVVALDGDVPAVAEAARLDPVRLAGDDTAGGGAR